MLKKLYKYNWVFAFVIEFLKESLKDEMHKGNMMKYPDENKFIVLKRIVQQTSSAVTIEQSKSKNE